MPSTYGWSSSANLSSDHSQYYQLDLRSTMTFNQVKLWPRRTSRRSMLSRTVFILRSTS